jgi:hypothetical protein
VKRTVTALARNNYISYIKKHTQQNSQKNRIYEQFNYHVLPKSIHHIKYSTTVKSVSVLIIITRISPERKGIIL